MLIAGGMALGKAGGVLIISCLTVDTQEIVVAGLWDSSVGSARSVTLLRGLLGTHGHLGEKSHKMIDFPLECSFSLARGAGGRHTMQD